MLVYKMPVSFIDEENRKHRIIAHNKNAKKYTIVTIVYLYA